MESTRDILGIGMVLMDFFVHADERTLEDLGLQKGGTTFVSGDRMDDLLRQAATLGVLGPFPGDNARNLCEAANLLGSRTAFLGALGTDSLGHRWRTSLIGRGVDLRLQAIEGRTGCAIAFITPDGERTFALDMGVSDELSMLPLGWPEGFGYVYVSSTTLLEESGTRLVALESLHRARELGVRIAVSLENPFLLERHPDLIREILSPRVSVLFGNQSELCSVFGPGDAGLARAVEVADLVFAKRGKDGSTVACHDGSRWEIPAFPADVLDTTGAGDFYGGAVLARLCQGASPRRAGLAGSRLAAQVVRVLGARLPRDFDPREVD